MSCRSPIMVKANDGSGYMMVPCGKCRGCRLDHARDFMVRLYNEARMTENSCVVNLSYDDEHIPENGTLLKSDYQKFLKLLRKRVYPDKIRYFLCGEYGDRFGRCHWHIIVYGINMYDSRVFNGHVPDGKGHFVVNCNCWDKGRVVVDKFSIESASYIARYTMKKVNGHTKDWYDEKGILPEFIAMSTKPGIGFSWMEKYKDDILTHDFIVVNGQKYRVPRYYFNKLGIKNTIGYELKQAQKHQDRLDELSRMDFKTWVTEAIRDEQKRQQKLREDRKYMEIKGR